MLYIIFLFQRSNNTAANVLREFLKERENAIDFENFTEEQLNDTLARFYLSARKSNGELYKEKSLQSLRCGINRFLQGPPHNKLFDIVKNKKFQKANEAFKFALTELDTQGKSRVKRTPAIAKEDLTKLYSSEHFDTNTPQGLANKVQFDIRMFFSTTIEAMDQMTKTSFEVEIHADGKKYLVQSQEELSKNRKEGDKEQRTSYMPEIGDMNCPVKSYEKYLSKLHPEVDWLWTYPNETFIEDGHWYTKKPLRLNTFKQFMVKMSKMASLSKIYTNLSIRASANSILTEADSFSADMIDI